MPVSRPHGGTLVNRIVPETKREYRLREAREMLSLVASPDALMDAEKIAFGAYSPLEGFMTQNEYLKVIREMHLLSGLPWTMPIIFVPPAVSASVLQSIKDGDCITLTDIDGLPIATMTVEDRFSYDKEELAKSVYGTLDPAHPDIAELMQLGDTALGGKIELLQRLKQPWNELMPAETRRIFDERGWKTIVGYQCRNPPHIAHEYLQRCALELVDGLFIHPVIGMLKKEDYSASVILQGYQALISNYYPLHRVLLSPLAIKMRYAGAKAAVFLALVRKNYGCTHFIAGRDIAGVGKFYEPYAAHKLLDELQLGIEIMKFDEVFYCTRCGWIASEKTCGHINSRQSISQTAIRAAIRAGKELPKMVLRPEVAMVLMKSEARRNDEGN